MSVKQTIATVPDICSEEDIPPERHENVEVKMSTKKVESYEDALNALRGIQDIEIRSKAFRLIVALIILISLFYISDTILTNFGLKSSSLLTGLFELLKFMLSSLFGFVFALKHKDK